MTEQIKIDFEKTIKASSFSERDAELKKGFLNKFIAKGFPSRKFENWKFSDMNQIIQKISENWVFIMIIHCLIKLIHQFL